MNDNTGFTPDEFDPQDYTFGAERSLGAKFQGEPLQPNGDWTDHLPVTERQAPLFETSACVSHHTLNAVETLKKRIFDNSDNLSDRFLAKGSGTTASSGNSPKKVADWLYRNWTVFEQEWPTNGPKTPEEFYADLPQNLKTLAIGRGAEYEFGYEFVQVRDIPEALKYSPVCIAVPAWHENAGVYYRPLGATDNHWTMVYGLTSDGHYKVFDSYEPFLKVVHKDIYPSVAMRYHLKRKIVQESFWQKFLKLLHDIIVGEKEVYPDDQPKEEPKKESKIELWAKAIADFESGGKPNSLAHRNNNPGNIKGTDGRFIKYKTYQDGFNALCDYLTRACTGKHKAYSPEMTLRQFFAVYAPDGDITETNYTNFVAKRIGVFPSEKIKNLV